MEYIVLDFSKCHTVGLIHQVLRNEFKFPEYYGENLSALWDCLDNYCDYPLTVIIKGYDELPKELDEYKEKIWSIFDRVSENCSNIIFIKE